MRTHAKIIEDVGVAVVARAAGVSANTAKPWRRLDSIPAPYWRALSDAGLATLDELADAAQHKARATQEAA